MLINTNSSTICDYVCVIIKYLSRRNHVLERRSLAALIQFAILNDDTATNDELNIINDAT